MVLQLIAAATAAFLTVLVAEFGDKSQLVCLAMACRYPPLQVLAGAMTAMAVVLGLAVGVGSLIAETIPHSLVAVGSGLFFIAIGVYTFIFGKEDTIENTGKTGYFQTLGVILLAELGDKTQLAAMFIAASFGYPLVVFAGAMLAMLVNQLLAVYVGSRFITRFNPLYIKIGSAALFVFIGLLMIIFEAGLIS